jgi:hypothetical protein
VHGSELIGAALGRAVNAIAVDAAIPFRPALDQDTRGVPGAPAMVAAILKKIDVCSVFVADVSLTFDRFATQRKSPNPNVLLELGYALKRLGTERVILVLDSTTGRPEQLPFDLRGNRVITYDSSADDEQTRGEMTKRFDESVRLILETAGPPPDIAPPVHIDLQFSKQRIESDRHDYRLHVSVVNQGTTILKDWAADLRFPSELLNPQRQYPVVGAPSDDGRVTMRILAANHSGPIFPGEKKEVLAVDYLMTHDLYDRRRFLFPQKVEALFYSEGRLLAAAARTIEDLQWF